MQLNSSRFDEVQGNDEDSKQAVHKGTVRAGRSQLTQQFAKSTGSVSSSAREQESAARAIQIQVISLFTQMFPTALEQSMLHKAKEKGIVEFSYINLRDFGLGPRKQVDDTVYGGGDGMLLRIEPLLKAIEFAKSQVTSHQSPAKRPETGDRRPETKLPKVILMTPRGKKFTQAHAKRLAAGDQGLIFVCARYEGYDERVVDYVDEQISIGDYVLTGGELPAMVVIDAVVRLLPGVLGGETSAEQESFADGKTLEHPQYTRPEEFRGQKAPEVLLSGDHAAIAKWRQQNSKKQS